MSLVHDLAESLVGDITPCDGVSKEEKYQKEKVSTTSCAWPYQFVHVVFRKQWRTSELWCLKRYNQPIFLSSFFIKQVNFCYFFSLYLQVGIELCDLWKVIKSLPTQVIAYIDFFLGAVQEYEEGKSPEAILVKDLDMFDMIFQAFEYEKCEARSFETL